MTDPKPYEDVYVLEKEVKGHKYYDVFNMYKTLECPDFYKFYKMREKVPNIKYTSYKGTFGPDIIRHFEICYTIIKESDLDISFGTEI